MKNKFETAFLLSPLFILVSIIFNVVDTKFILSRLIPVVCIYCLFFFRGAIKKNLENENFKKFSISTLFVILYFTILHFYRGDEFTLARTLIAALAYMLLIPWKTVEHRWVYAIIAFGGISAGLSGIYEYYYLGIPRVGIASNPIPFAFYCASLSLFCLYLVLYKVKGDFWLATLAVLGFLFSNYALLLTDVRGVWIAIPVAGICLLSKKVLSIPSRKTVIISIVTVIALGIAAKPTIESRWGSTVFEYEQISSGNFNTSIGMRLILWKNGLEFIQERPLVGFGDRELTKQIHSIETPWAKQFPHLHNQYIDLSARSGLVGLILILGWLCTILAGSGLFSTNNKTQPFLTSFIVLFLIASFTDVHLIHAHIVYLISMLSGILLIKDEIKQGKVSYTS